MQEDTFESDRSNAKNFGGAVYVGGVIAATMLFITFVLTAFPKDAYFSRVIMTIAGLAVGASMLAFPVALHNWAIERKHRRVTTWLYYTELIFISVNTIVSFVNLLATVTGYEAPPWAILYEPFSVVSIIYVIFAWGTIFLTDPEAKIKQQSREYDIEFKSQVQATKLQYLKSPAGRNDIARAAQEEINAVSERASADDLFSHVLKKKEATTQSPSFRSENALPCGHTEGVTNHESGFYACKVCTALYAISEGKLKRQDV